MRCSWSPLRGDIISLAAYILDGLSGSIAINTSHLVQDIGPYCAACSLHKTLEAHHAFIMFLGMSQCRFHAGAVVKGVVTLVVPNLRCIPAPGNKFLTSKHYGFHRETPPVRARDTHWSEHCNLKCAIPWCTAAPLVGGPCFFGWSWAFIIF